MDRDLIIRIALCCVFVAAVLIATQAGRGINIVAPLSVVGVGLVMFWPRRDVRDVAPPESGDRA
ncbi:hypothetical protein ACUY28_08250 [Corynebacterium sanguinis]